MHSFSNLERGCKRAIGWDDGGAGDARLELCLLVCKLVVDRAFDLTRLLQELGNELKRTDVIVTISSITRADMTHCRVSSVDRFLEADSGGGFNVYPTLLGCNSRRYSPSPTHIGGG